MAKTAKEGHEKLEIRIEDSIYDITEFIHKHPGGSVIMYANSFQDSDGHSDATEAFMEFHSRSPKAHLMLRSLPNRPATSKRDPLMLAFQEWRQQLVKEGYFDPTPGHVVYRLTELAGMFLLGLYFFSWCTPLGLGLGVITHGLFGARCGWVQHEGGHNSLTGKMKVDKAIQKMTIGFGLGASGKMWNLMHEKHHATPQKIGHDLDLDTTPLVAFFKTAVEDNRPRGFSRVWAKFQHYTFLPVTSGTFVMMFWLLFLHPRQVVRSGDVVQGMWMLMAHTIRPLAIMTVTGYSFMTCYALLWACMWVSGVYLFGHFSTSHTHTEVVKRDETKNWLLFALEHTVDINPSSPVVNWVMGYLNCQVLHHLFPNMPQHRQPEVSEKLVEFCKQHGLKYEIVSYYEAWRRTFANLAEVGEHYYLNGTSKERASLKYEDVGAKMKRMREELRRSQKNSLGA